MYASCVHSRAKFYNSAELARVAKLIAASLAQQQTYVRDMYETYHKHNEIAQQNRLVF